jgi:tRNA pseudouridine55 synthase
VDKPKGWTSHDVCAKLKGALRLKKIGHAGTLDPMATGLLIVCTGKGTKWVDVFVAQARRMQPPPQCTGARAHPPATRPTPAQEKGYTGTLRLGEATPSYDAETEARGHGR